MANDERFARGASVRTTKEDPEVAETYTEEGKRKRRWGVEGTIGSTSDAHGLSYEVNHADGSRGYYGPSELEAV
jgi:hypothetical protein